MSVETAPRSTKRPRKTPQQPLEAANVPDALLKIRTVAALTGRCENSIYRLEKLGEFPRAIRAGKRCTRWRAGDVKAWLAAQATSTAAD